MRTLRSIPKPTLKLLNLIIFIVLTLWVGAAFWFTVGALWYWTGDWAMWSKAVTLLISAAAWFTWWVRVIR